MPEALAKIASYEDLGDTLRERAAALHLSFEMLDTLSGLADRYTVKVFPPHPQTSMRTLGKASLGCILGAIGCELLLIENPHAMIKLSDRIARIGQRNEAQVRNGRPSGIPEKQRLRSDYFRILGRRGGRARVAAMTPAEISKLGKRGARAMARAIINGRFAR
jgi:hypothetical protein